MLVNVNPQKLLTDSTRLMVVKALSGGKKAFTRLENGIYLVPSGNFHLALDDVIIDGFPAFDNERSFHGTCDNVRQVLEHYPEISNDENKHYVIEIMELNKKDQPKWCGFRWDSRGKYIGDQNPQCDYLYDEPKIDSVLYYHIYEVKRPERLTIIVG
jgi:hypothetical protein